MTERIKAIVDTVTDNMSVLDELEKLEREFLDDRDYPRRADVVVNARYEIERAIVLLQEQHEAMEDVMTLRRLSENQTTREKAESAISVYRKVETFLALRRLT